MSDISDKVSGISDKKSDASLEEHPFNKIESDNKRLLRSNLNFMCFILCLHFIACSIIALFPENTNEEIEK